MSRRTSPFSRRTDWPRQTNRITRVHEELKEQNIQIVDLTVSNPTHCGLAAPPEFLDALRDPAGLEYAADAHGLLSAREAVAGLFARRGLTVDPRDLFLTASTSEAYGFVFRLLADPGDTILFPTPSYPLFHFLGEINDVELGFYPLTYRDGWHIDMAGLVEALHPRVKALVTVNPNNPTGSYLSEEERRHLNKIAAERDMALISDEVFYEFPLGDAPGASLAGNAPALTFTLGGLSKFLGLPQMKLAWILLSGPDHLAAEARQRLEIIADTYLSVNTPVQCALPAWLRQADTVQAPILRRVRENWEYLNREAAGLRGTQVLRAEGGWYAVLKVAPVRSEEEWVLKLLSKYHVFVHPGFFYDFEDGPCLVVSLLVPPDDFREGIGRVLSRVEQQGGA
ncbi:MAG: pyridoxal phosphate-dependent aminotransferase [Candidatus Omnitrophica bacterium]|nr:pyridoxal phosphate-dependent aminotransferase [Candidatus Omnitrophota bacterium]MCB9719405.1 pyridoxal phosphate-dependent aminotransferase [Candidatus Omnitrophota bacterium]